MKYRIHRRINRRTNCALESASSSTTVLTLASTSTSTSTSSSSTSKLILALIVTLTLTLPLSLAPNTANAEITVVDDFDRNVTLPTHAERILSLGPHITENLFSAGAGDKIIGITAHSDYPPAANNIQSIGSAYAGINLEAVLSLKPDFIVAWQTAGNRDSLAKLIEWGFVLYYSEPRTFDDIIDNIRDFAELAGTRIESTRRRRRCAMNLQVCANNFRNAKRCACFIKFGANR